MNKSVEANNRILEICGNDAKHDEQVLEFLNGRKIARQEKWSKNG